MQVRKPSLLQRLTGRLGLDRAGVGRLALGTRLVITSDSGETLANYGLKTNTTTRTGTGLLWLLTVPDGKRWHVTYANAYRATGDRDATGMYYRDASEGIYVSFEAFSASSSIFWPVYGGYPFSLDENDQLGVYLSGGTTDGNWTMVAHIREEDLQL